MKIIGKKETFAFEYEKISNNEYALEMYVGGAKVCTYIKDNLLFKYSWNIYNIINWFEENMENILKEDVFPLKSHGKCGVELYENSWAFDTDDIEILEQRYEKRQDWYFKHSWFSSREGSFLADIFFRRVNDDIEISWNNVNTYNDIKFIYSCGCYLVNMIFFKNVINKFIMSIKME